MYVIIVECKNIAYKPHYVKYPHKRNGIFYYICNMINLLLLALITSLFIFGWHYCVQFTPNVVDFQKQTGYGDKVPENSAHTREVAWWFKYYLGSFLVKYFPSKHQFISKPLWGCPVCMSSVYGTMFYWAYILNSNQIINSKTFILWVVQVVVVAGINRLLKSIMDK